MTLRKKFLAMVACGLFVALITGLSTPVRAQCPRGWKTCLSDSTPVCVPPDAECGIPDSGSVECASTMCEVQLLPLSSERSLKKSFTITAAGKTAPGSGIDAVARTNRSAPFEAAIVRHDDGKWVFRAAPVAARAPAAGTVRLLSRGKIVATRTLTGNADVAEAAELPSGIAVESSGRGTSIRWTYSVPMSARLYGARGMRADPVEMDAVEIQFASGATGPVRALALRGMGIGRLAVGGQPPGAGVGK